MIFVVIKQISKPVKIKLNALKVTNFTEFDRNGIFLRIRPTSQKISAVRSFIRLVPTRETRGHIPPGIANLAGPLRALIRACTTGRAKQKKTHQAEPGLEISAGATSSCDKSMMTPGQHSSSMLPTQVHIEMSCTVVRFLTRSSLPEPRSAPSWFLFLGRALD